MWKHILTYWGIAVLSACMCWRVSGHINDAGTHSHSACFEIFPPATPEETVELKWLPSLCPHLSHFHLCLLLCFFFIHLNSFPFFFSNIYRRSTNLLLLWLLFALFFRSAPRSPRSSDNQANQRERICAVSVALALFTSLVRLQFLKHMHPETHTHTQGEAVCDLVWTPLKASHISISISGWSCAGEAWGLWLVVWGIWKWFMCFNRLRLFYYTVCN